MRKRIEELENVVEMLKATLESTADGIVANRRGEIFYNSQYQQMWSIPDPLLQKTVETSERIAWNAAQTKDPEKYVARVKELGPCPENESFEVVELKDGRIFERYVKPQRIGGRSVGVVVNFRDITARKRAEAELAIMHKQLLDASRQAGMAEVAIGVLHNVGNVLNSVNVSANLIADGARDSKVANLTRLVALLHEHEHDLGEFVAQDQRGRHLPAVLAHLAEDLLAQQQLVIREADLLRNHIAHINAIVSAQQAYAKVSGLKEIVDVQSLIEDCLRMNADVLERPGVIVTRDFMPVPAINTEKNKILQVLANLMRNAVHACDESGRSNKSIIVSLLRAGGFIRIVVQDNGVGIAPENLTRIFGHGFTTRKDGHGFGLHSGALAARELGGGLYVRSDGLGHGAAFTLDVPFEGGAQRGA